MILNSPLTESLALEAVSESCIQCLHGMEFSILRITRKRRKCNEVISKFVSNHAFRKVQILRV